MVTSQKTPEAIEDDKIVRRQFRALTLQLVPPGWGVIRNLLFQHIDRMPPEQLVSLRASIKEAFV